MIRPIAALLTLLFAGNSQTQNQDKKILFKGYAQGTTYTVTYFNRDSLVRQSQIDSILNKVDSSLSLYKPYSLVSKFNSSAKGIEVDNHFKIVINKSIETFKATNGLFDITVFPLTDLWGFGPVRKASLPTGAAIKNAKKCVNADFLSWKGMFLKKKKSCVQIDPNGIAQGYAVDLIANFMEEQGIHNYVVELGGELRVRGRKPDGSRMTVGIEGPDSDADFSIIEQVIELDSGAVTTSGSYRRYYESQSKKITHLINPKTGYTLNNELISVTVVAPDAITADAFDNAIMLMGLLEGLKFVESHKELAAHFIYRKNDGMIADTASSRFIPLLKR